MDSQRAYHVYVEQDPAILAFIKCHLSSFLRWDLLRLLSGYGERWTETAEAARELHKPQSAIEAELKELEQEGLLVARRSSNSAVAYQMDPAGPSTLVAERLFAAATRSQELRQIIVARVLGGTSLAS